MKKIKAADYKGKWFVLCDELDDDGMDWERSDVDVSWATQARDWLNML